MIARFRDVILASVVALTALSIWAILPLEKKLNLGLDLQGGMHLVLEVDKTKVPDKTTVADAVDRAIEIVRNRVDALGVSEPSINKQGDSWIIVQLPGIKDPERAIELIGQTALLEFKLVSEKKLDEYLDKDGKVIAKKLPADLEVVPGNKDERAIYLLEKTQLLTGASLSNASPQPGEMGTPVVGFEMTSEGGKVFADLTGRHVGRQLAIILDGKVFSAPVIRSRIGGGKGVIEGRFSWDEARGLALVLRAGAMPAPVTIVNKEIVGPSLGRDSIDRGKKAALAGIALVLLLMGVYYKLSGVIADVGLICNFLFLMAIMAMMHATMTLPGIAGIALTMGMSVDSNVLIFERIREEMRAGKTVRTAIENGYNRALLTIIDSHVTTLITTAVLYFFGSGPIRGFAVTLFWGVAISLFTALVITKAIFEMRKQYESLSI
jgi:protein-export membrane protein SecD